MEECHFPILEWGLESHSVLTLRCLHFFCSKCLTTPSTSSENNAYGTSTRVYEIPQSIVETDRIAEILRESTILDCW